MNFEEDPRTELPASLTDLVSETTIRYPLDGTRRRYNFAFAYDYGMDLVLSNILAGAVEGTVKVKFVFFSLKYSQELLKFKGLDPISFNLIGGGTFDTASGNHEQTVVSESQQPWKASYESVPFIGLEHVPQPPSDAVADAVVNTDRAEEFLYSNLCQCVAHRQACSRTEDCCTDGGDDIRCFSDPALEGEAVCDSCRRTIYTDIQWLQQTGKTSQDYHSCNVASDCCEQGAECTRTAVPTSCRYVPLGDLQLWQCEAELPPYKVCQRPTPYQPPDVVK